MVFFLQKRLLFNIFFAFAFDVVESGFNVAYLKRTEANFTCGNPPEDFYETQQGLLAPEDRVPYTCNASDPEQGYPPENMVDGLLETHWQSRKGEDLAVITISFEQAFFAQDISITFGNYRRPGQIKVEKSTDFGATFTPWHYLVTPPASIQCRRQFRVEAQSVITRVDQVLCTEYTEYVPQEFNETIFIQLNHQQRGDGTPDPYTPGLQAWMNTTGVRITFSGLFRKFDTMSILWHHYTVREIQVTGRCDCKGHANGTHCPLNQTTGLRTCQCEGNTCGAQCDQCCPLYNQIQWKIGNGAPWTNDPAASCEPCNCHNHAHTCVYNQTVSDLGLSMSVNGSMIGGGMCIDCQHNTQGINCEKCKVYFFRLVDKNQSDPDACKACNCNTSGTADVENVSFGDCVRDENELLLHSGKQPGDCYCKAFVQGRQCDTCQAGYYRLTQGNPDGCLACNCHLNGTISRSDVCQEDYHGQCNCKSNVDFRDCSQCKDGYYDLQDSDVNGCKPCNCDVGGSSSGQNCDKITGFCRCRSNVIGKFCNSTATGFYYPNTHFIQATKSPYKPSTDQLYVLLDIPKAGDYSLLVKYTYEGRDAVHTQVTVQFKNTSEAGEFFNFSATLQECNNCPATINEQYVLLRKGLWMVNVTTPQQSDQLKLDGVIAIPKEFIEAAVLDRPLGQDFVFYCSVVANHMSSDSRCLPWLFSITMDFLEGALPCECDAQGSNSTICEEYGGQCSCKPGVEGRDCSRCKPGFYNLTDSGCTRCGCNGPNQVCEVTTGECECPENTVGRTCLPCQCNNNTNKCLRTGECLECQFNTTGFYCQHCDNGTFGDAALQQCQACACSEIGSLDQTCDRVSGQCNCKTKVTGRNCTLCEANTFNFSFTGCEDCGCNTFGSASLQCSVSGQCPCKANATGLKCAQCTSGFYGLPVEPCRGCECNTTGSIPDTVCTNDTIGQCQCKPGVTGRSCDQCMKFFTDLSDAGCEACSMCIQNLRGMIANNSYNVNETDVKVHSLKKLTDFNEPMAAVSTSLRQAKDERERFYSRISAGDQLYQDLTTSQVPENNNTLKELSIRAGDLSNFANEAAANTTKILEDITYEKEATLSARQYVTSVDVIIGDVREALEEYNAAATQALTHSTEAWQKTMERNFTQYSWNITEHTRMAENISAHVEETLTRVVSQLFRARELDVSTQEKAANFNQVQESWNQSHALFMDSVEQVYNHSREIQAILMDTKNLLERGLIALNNTSASLVNINATLNDTRNVLIAGTTIFEQNRRTLSPVNGELEVSMLQYEEEQTQFVIRIERGRNLPPKDLNSQTSDPYVLVSTIPDWNNEGTQKSSTVNGELNPDFPFGDVFRFKITMEQLNFTQVRLAVYDDDPDDEDDFMGVAFIDLSKVGDFFDNIVTEWYSLIPQDPSDIGSGNFVPSSGLGLTDVSNLLETEVNKIKQKLALAESKLQQAQNQASYLESLAHQMEQTFNGSRSHGTPALSAIERYSEISEFVNRSLDLVKQANNTINMIYQQLSVFSLDDIQITAEITWQEFYDLYNLTLQRNITAQNLERTIHEANLTFINSVNKWNQIYEQFPAIQDAAAKFRNVTEKAPAVTPPLMEAQIKVTNTSVLLSDLEARLSETELVLETLLNKTAFIKESSHDGIIMINEAFTNVQNISARLTPNPTESPVNATVREAKTVMMSLAPSRQETEVRMANVSSKLDQIRSMSMSLPFALYLEDDALVTLVPSTRTIENPFQNEISFDFKTEATEGLLMNIVGEPQESRRTRRSNWLTNSLALHISNDTVNVAYNLGDGPIMAQNPLVLNNDTWYNVYFTRFGANGFLTVSADTDTRETVMINGSAVSGNTMLQLTNQSVIYLGGLPANQSESQVFDHFSGVIDNLAIDNKRYNLWDPKETLGSTRYAVPRYKVGFFPASGKAASFYGNGFIQHALGQFDISSGYTQMEVDFKTLHQNGIIMAVSNEQQKYIFVLYLHNGYVNFYFEPGEDDGILLTTSRSSYGDGRWYRIRVVHTSVNATLTVNLVGSLEAPDGRYVDTGETVMDNGHVITFGALILNSVSNFEVTDVFSGDMDNLLLFSSKAASLVTRYFNDPALMTAKQGVSFSGVIRGKTEYGTRFFGYQEETGDCSYASIDISSETATMLSLTFTFKTNRESGVLLYSESDMPGAPTLYMTLFHGDLLLWLGNIESDLVFSSSNITFSDNSWRVIHLQLSDSGYALYVNDSLLFTDILDFVASPLILNQPFYMGGIPLNESSQVPYALCFTGGMKDLIIDSSSVSFFSGHSVGVSNAGVIPARVPPPTPPSCRAPLSPPTASNNDRTVHFDLQGSKGKGYIGFKLSEDQSNIFEQSFVVGVTFRALSDDGLLLYATDNDTHPTQFFSVELVERRILFQFNSGRGLVSVSTKQKYSGNGHWYTVFILRMLHFGAILMSTNEYANGRHTPPGEPMNLRRLYIGGLPSHVIAPTVTNRYLGFAGCIKDFDIANAPDSLFDLSKPNMTGSNETRGTCYDTAQPGLGFNGSGWVRFDNFSLNAEFNVQLTFRTSSRDGVLFLINGNSTSSPGNRKHVRLELSSGQIVLTYNTTMNESQVIWTEPGLGNDTQSSYLMCQMNWHSVRVTKKGPNVTITLDELHSVSSLMGHGTNITGELFLGGYPAQHLGGGNEVTTGLKGCLKKFTLDGNSLHFAHAADLSQVSSACPLTSSEKQSAIENEP